MPKRNKPRTIEQIMQADYLRLHDEAPKRYPLAGGTLVRLAKEGRIQTYGTYPQIVKVRHLEAQLEAGFPVIRNNDEAA